MKPIEIYFCHDYYARKLGIHTDQNDWEDPIRRTEVDRAIRRELYHRFGELGIGEKNPSPRPQIAAYGHRLLAKAAGGEVVYLPDSEPSAVVADDAEHRMLHLDLSKLPNSDVVRKSLSDAKILRAKYGFASGEFNMGSALNTAIAAYGDAFFYACCDEPELATQVLIRMNQLMMQLYALVSHEIEPMRFPLPMRYAFYGNCPAIMISPEMYKKVVLPADLWLRNRVDTFMLHHCGILDNYAELYQALRPDILDVGGGSNYLQMRKIYPQTPCWLIISNKDVETASSDGIRSLVHQIARDAGPEEYITKIYVSDIAGDTQDRVIYDLATAHLD